MRRRNYTAATLALAGIMAFGGTGVLFHNISSAREEDMVSVGKQTADSAEQAQAAEEWEGMIGTKKVYQEREKIYLPEGAKIKEESKEEGMARYKIAWNGREIFYLKSGSERESQSDISIGDAVMIAEKAVDRYSGQDVSGRDVSISLERNVPEEDDPAFAPIDGDSGSMSPAINRKNYGIRYYCLSIDGVGSHSYILRINSVTGEVFGYADFYEKDADGFQGYHDGEAVKKAKPEFSSIAGKFVTQSLELGKVTEYYAFHSGLMETEKATRETFDVYCRTEENDIVVVTLDQESKRVLCFEINPLLGE